MRSDISIPQAAFDGPPQQRAAGLIDTADNDCNAFQRRRDGRRHSHVDLSSANPMANRGRGLGRPRRMAACDYNAACVIRREFGRYPPPDDAIAADDQNVSIIQAIFPSEHSKQEG